MAAELALVDITGERGEVLAPGWLAKAEPVHRKLRDQLPADYAGRLAAVFANGARMSVVAIWRLVENTYEGRRLYVDNLVTDTAHRSQGVGRFLIAQLEARARDLGCDVLALDSGTQRTFAHRFYFREGFVIPSFCFRKTLK